MKFAGSTFDHNGDYIPVWECELCKRRAFENRCECCLKEKYTEEAACGTI